MQRLFSRLKNLIISDYASHSHWFFVAFIFGIILRFNHNLNLSIIYLVLFSFFSLLLCIIFYSRGQRLLFFLSGNLVLFVVGIASAQNSLQKVHNFTMDEPARFFVVGEIEKMMPANNKMQILLNNVSIAKIKKGRAGKYKKISGKIRIVSSFNSNNDFSQNVGEKIKVKAQLFPLKQALLPYSYDFSFFMRMDDIVLSGFALNKYQIIAKQESSASQIANFRAMVYQRLIEILGDRQGNFLAAILIGETKNIPNEVNLVMRDSGAAHILSVSGLHLSLVAVTIFAFVRAVLNFSDRLAAKYNTKIIACVISILGSFLYLLLSGVKIAAIRAFIMTSCLMLAIIFGRSLYLIRVIFISATIILLIWPQYIMHPSFQLSFIAVIGLVSGYNINNYFTKGGGISSIWSYFCLNIYSSILASLATAPYVIANFYKFANYSILINLVAVPVMSFIIMPCSMLGLLLINTGLDVILFKIVGFFIELIITSASYTTSLKGSVYYSGFIYPHLLIAFSFAFFWLVIVENKLKFIALPVIFIVIYQMLNIPKPIFAYSKPGNIYIVGADGLGDDGYTLYSPVRISNFTKEYVASWLGERNVSAKNLLGDNYKFTISANHTISFCSTDCVKANIMVLTNQNLTCKKYEQLIDYNEFQQIAYLLIYKDGDNFKIEKSYIEVK